MPVPTRYEFSKETTGNVLVTGYAFNNDPVPVEVEVSHYSLQPGKDLRIDDRLPDNVIIPLEISKGAQNLFLSIPYSKIDLANSSPAGTNPTTVVKAIDALAQDFFFELAGGGGSSSARNGLDVVSGHVELGGELIRDTKIDTNGNILNFKNGNYEILLGEFLGADGVFISEQISANLFAQLGVSSNSVFLQIVNTANLELYQFAAVNGSISMKHIPSLANPNVNNTGIVVEGDYMKIIGLDDYVDDAAAAVGGVPVNGIYRNGSVLQIRVS